MSKIQTILCLFVFLIVLFSMDSIFGNPLRETFGGGGGRGGLGGRNLGGGLGVGSGLETGLGLGLGLGQRVLVNGYPNSGFLAANVPPTYYSNSDDQPLFFDFPFRFIRGN
jgi:hypothetical protein